MVTTPPPVIVGVTSGQPDAVVLAASVFATHFGGELICASVDPSRLVLAELPDGTITSASYDPDSREVPTTMFDAGLLTQVERVLHGRAVSWSTRALAGETAEALGRLAATVHAAMIVVGTSESNLRHTLTSFFTGSVAVRLAHGQHCPVVIIPLRPVPFSEQVPWAE